LSSVRKLPKSLRDIRRITILNLLDSSGRRQEDIWRANI